jgi:hypothetical protein
MTVVGPKVPLLQILARLGFNGITVTILNRLLKDVPKEFLKVKPCTAVEKVCALISWTLKGTGDHDLHKLLAGWFDRRVPTKPLIHNNAAFSDAILDPDSKNDLQNEHKKIEEQDTSFCIMYWLCVFAVLEMHCCPWFACVADFFVLQMLLIVLLFIFRRPSRGQLRRPWKEAAGIWTHLGWVLVLARS